MDRPVLAEIFSQGDEVVTGQITDTNAAWLAQRLQHLGFDILRHSTVGDRLERLVGLLREIACRADCCVCTGGLGPTVDDLTAEAVALAFERPLGLDRDALAQIERYFDRRGYPMPATNTKQAMVPNASQRLDNLCGTAPGFTLQQGRCFFAFLPGVPAEMKAMFTQQVEPRLAARFRLRPTRLIILRTIGLGESTLQQRLEGLELPASVRLGFRAAVPENEVKFLFPPDFPVAEASALVDQASRLLGDAVVSIDGVGLPGGNLAAVIGRMLLSRSATLAAAETASAGQLAWQCRGQRWLAQSLVAGDAGRVWSLLGGDPGILPDDPVQAGPLLAERLRENSGARYALVNLGTIPHDSALAADPGPSTVTLALAGPHGTVSRQVIVAGSPDRRCSQVAAWSLDDLRHALAAAPEATGKT